MKYCTLNRHGGGFFRVVGELDRYFANSAFAFLESSWKLAKSQKLDLVSSFTPFQLTITVKFLRNCL